MRWLDLEIYAWIARYLDGEATFEEFEDWFAPETWRVEASGSPEAIELAEEIRPALVEVSADAMDENDFRALLKGLQDRRRERVRYFQDAIAQTGTRKDTPLVTAALGATPESE